MKLTSEELEFGRQMDAAANKQDLVEIVLANNCTRVLDLGAGTGLIAKTISEHGIYADAVDHSFKLEKYHNTKFLRYINDDLLHFAQTTECKYDCVILSGIMHELSKEVRVALAIALRRILDPEHSIILIREPLYADTELGYYHPFRSTEAQRRAMNTIRLSIPADAAAEFAATPKLSETENEVPDAIKSLNLAFTYSYGKSSWHRERSEYRFAYSINAMTTWCRSILGKEAQIKTVEVFDSSYHKHFADAGYSDTVINSITYTGMILIATIGENNYEYLAN